MLGESKLHVHRDPEKGVCLRASVAVAAGDVLFREMPLLSASTAFAKSFFVLFRASSSAQNGMACPKYVQSTILKRYLDEGRLLIHQQ